MDDPNIYYLDSAAVLEGFLIVAASVVGIFVGGFILMVLSDKWKER